MTELARDRLFPFTPETFCSSVCLLLFAYLFLFKQSGILSETQVMLSQLTTTVRKKFAAFYFFFHCQ